MFVESTRRSRTLDCLWSRSDLGKYRPGRSRNLTVTRVGGSATSARVCKAAVGRESCNRRGKESAELAASKTLACSSALQLTQRGSSGQRGRYAARTGRAALGAAQRASLRSLRSCAPPRASHGKLAVSGEQVQKPPRRAARRLWQHRSPPRHRRKATATQTSVVAPCARPWPTPSASRN